VGVEGVGGARRGLRGEGEAMREVDKGAYHTLDQVCIVGRKA